MMKPTIKLILLLMVFFSDIDSYGQCVSLDFPVSMTGYQFHDRPTMKLLDDTLYVCCPDGVYAKDLITEKGWEPCAFKGLRIFDFVKNGDKLLGLGSNASDDDPSFIVRCEKGGSPIDVTPEELHGFDHNPYLPAFSLDQPLDHLETVILSTSLGLLVSYDFGNSWEQSPCFKKMDALYYYRTSINPSDPSEVVCYGEEMTEEGSIYTLKNFEIVSLYNVPDVCQPICDFIFNMEDSWQRCYCAFETFGSTKDGGETWKEISLPGTFGTLASKGSDEGTVYIIGRAPVYGPEPTMLQVYQYRYEDGSWNHCYKCDLPSGMKSFYDAVFWGDELILLTNVGVFSISDIDKIASQTLLPPKDHAVYDISGRKVPTIKSHGIFIQDGKKIVR